MRLTDHSIDTLAETVNEEVIYQNPLLFLRIWEIYAEIQGDGAQKKHSWHYHKEVELLAVVEGSLGVENKHRYTVLRPGDVMILGASQPHRSHTPELGPLRYVVFQVDLGKHFDQSTLPYLHAFSELTQPLDELNYIFEQNKAAEREAHALIMDIHKESQERMRGYEIAISSAIKKLILLLLRNDTRNVLNYTEEFELNRIRPVLDYVDTCLADKVNVEDASAMLNMSYYYFIKYFKKIMGVSFLDYVNYKRIKKSELLLLTSDLSISNVGYDVGISNMAHFYKLFKRYNQCSPKEFKQRAASGVPAGDLKETSVVKYPTC